MNLLLFSVAAASALCCAAQTISIEQLSHRIPAIAAREYRASEHALARGEVAASIAHCRKAISLDPDNAAAHNDLGVLYLNSGQTEEALDEFTLAVRLQPRLTSAHLNAGFAALSLGRPEEAEASVSRALEIERSNRRGHLLRGWILASQHRYTTTALESLAVAAREFPEAHLAAADVLVHRGSLDGARAEVEAYLAEGAVELRPTAEAWLRFLKIDE